MPPQGKSQFAPPARRRNLRAHSKLTAADELRAFFAHASIPKFSDQVLEAYVKAIAPSYDSEIEPLPADSQLQTSGDPDIIDGPSNQTLEILSPTLSNNSADVQGQSESSSSPDFLRDVEIRLDPQQPEKQAKPTQDSSVTSTSPAIRRDSITPIRPQSHTSSDHPHWESISESKYLDLASCSYLTLCIDNWVDVEIPNIESRARCTCKDSCGVSCQNRFVNNLSDLLDC